MPRAQATVRTPGSFADEEYYGINAFVFVNNKGHAGVMPDGGRKPGYPGTYIGTGSASTSSILPARDVDSTCVYAVPLCAV